MIKHVTLYCSLLNIRKQLPLSLFLFLSCISLGQCVEKMSKMERKKNRKGVWHIGIVYIKGGDFLHTMILGHGSNSEQHYGKNKRIKFGINLSMTLEQKFWVQICYRSSFAIIQDLLHFSSFITSFVCSNFIFLFYSIF